jgi:hypothetical protein
MRKILLTFAVTALLTAGACGKKRPADALDDNYLTEVTNAEEPVSSPGAELQARCAATAIYDRIKLELFRQAVELRGRDQAAFNKIAKFSFVRMEDPVPRGYSQASGETSCTGRLTLDLPPGLAVAGGGNRLTGDVGYSITPAAGGNATVTLSGADEIAARLATLAPAAAPPRAEPAASDPLAPSADPLAPRPAPPPANAARPSFSCGNARTLSERAVCASPGLAALDRSMAVVYTYALDGADARTASELRRTRDSFLAYRERCPTDACIADAYRGRIREINDIIRESR